MEENHMRNLLVAQSGGPTAAINATVAGVVSCAVLSGKVDHIYGAVNGIEGVLAEKFLDLGKKLDSAEKISLLMQTPAAALGSCRYKLGDPKENTEDFEEILRIFRRHEIRYFIYIGGNDSMDTVNKLSKYCKENGVEDVFVVGAPKTIDNDLVGTDHCPGFGSAAKYLAATFAELERDCHVYEKKAVTIVEVMGRNAGWLTAASALSRVNGGEGPNLIYLCEPAFDTEQFLKDVQEKLEQKDSVLVAISEGIHDSEGRYVSEQVQSDAQDQFGHSYIAGSAKVLEELVRDRIGCKVRSIELNLMQRCAAHLASATDLEDARHESLPVRTRKAGRTDGIDPENFCRSLPRGVHIRSGIGSGKQRKESTASLDYRGRPRCDRRDDGVSPPADPRRTGHAVREWNSGSH